MAAPQLSPAAVDLLVFLLSQFPVETETSRLKDETTSDADESSKLMHHGGRSLQLLFDFIKSKSRKG